MKDKIEVLNQEALKLKVGAVNSSLEQPEGDSCGKATWSKGTC